MRRDEGREEEGEEGEEPAWDVLQVCTNKNGDDCLFLVHVGTNNKVSSGEQKPVRGPRSGPEGPGGPRPLCPVNLWCGRLESPC